MTATLLERRSTQEPTAVRPVRAGRRVRRSRWSELAWLGPLLIGALVVQAWGMTRAPERFDDEGTYTAQAYAVGHFHQLAHYTYWYDHPPLGWLQISLWTWLTGAFDRLTPAVMAGREAMLVAHGCAVAFLWLLGRRVGLTRPAAAAAAAVFSLSPLALGFHRMVYLDNVATPWLLAALWLGAARRHQLRAFTLSAACFAVMVLTKETTLLLLPIWAWWLWRHADRSTRRYTLTVAGSVLALAGTGYVAFATLKGELLPGARHVSLFGGVAFQLFERKSSGSVLDPTSQAGDTVQIWLAADTVLPIAATVAAVLMLPMHRWRPFAAAYLLLLVMLLRPGYLPVPYPIVMLPFGALLVAAVVDEGSRRRGQWRPLALVAGATALAFAAPSWWSGTTGLMTRDMDRPMRMAEQWLEKHAGHDDRLLVDDSVWVDLVRAGFPRDKVVWYYKADTDPEVMRATPHGWRDYDYLMVTESIRQSVRIGETQAGGGAYPAVVRSFEHSRPVAVFGTGNQAVQLRQIVHGSTPPKRHRGPARRTAR